MDVDLEYWGGFFYRYGLVCWLYYSMKFMSWAYMNFKEARKVNRKL